MINAQIKMLRGAQPAKTVIRRVQAIGALTHKPVPPMVIHALAVVQISAQPTMWKAVQPVKPVTHRDRDIGVLIRVAARRMVILVREAVGSAAIKARQNNPMFSWEMVIAYRVAFRIF